jgi:Protein of unknown function (DUF2630)
MADTPGGDADIQDRIEELEREREQLHHREEQAAQHDRDDLPPLRERLAEIGVELDRLWDLERQRRALRSSGGDADDASERSGPTVEGYLG